MGKKVKTGKSRQDKFYKLAKESGYRARSAFKLLQLNRKYEFLQQSRVCVDLCAAPGGWLQVASENMPISSVIIGIDLVPIKPVRNCITFQEDITTQKCRQQLRKELKTWNADVFLHDGAPNVGKSWIHDAFAQAELTLHAFKLASEFLRQGGWFVTKVFRSKDYTSLMWVFNQLFKKVFATKPQASRLESAEIFVVCQGYLKPDKLDPKFVDPKHVFKDVVDLSMTSLNIIHPTKIKKKAEGYGDDETVLHHKLQASVFIRDENYLQLLGNTHQIIIDEDFVMNHVATTKEIKECCKDIKVLGKGELRSLISWRKKLAKSLEKSLENSDKSNKVEKTVDNEDEHLDKDSEDDNADVDEDDNEDNIDEKIAELKEAEEKLQRKKKKKVLKEKRKLRDKMNLNMIIKGDKFEIGEDLELFSLKKIKNKSELDKFENDVTEMNENVNNESEDEIRPTKERYDKNDKSYLNIYGDDDEDKDQSNDEEDVFEESSEEEEEDDEDEEMEIEEIEKNEQNPLLVNIEDKDTILNRKMELWYNKESFKELDIDDNEDFELAQMTKEYESKGGSVVKGKSNIKSSSKKVNFDKSISKGFSNDPASADSDDEEYNIEKVLKGKPSIIGNKGKTISPKTVTFNENTNKELSDDSGSSDSEDDEHNLKKTPKNRKKDKRDKTATVNNSNKDKFEIVAAKKIYKLSPEELAIGEELLKSSKRRREIVESSYNRFTYADENLPEWFVEDEKKRIVKELPITQEQVDFYKERNKAINTRTIKKVAEAKARKKKKVAKRLEKVRKKAENITESQDVSEKEKWAQIKQAYKKAGLLSNKKKDVTYVVAKRGAGKKVSRPAGVKGHFKVVDPRMKKDLRKEKINMKNNKNKNKNNNKNNNRNKRKV